MVPAEGYVGHKSKGKAHVYLPAVRRDEVVRRSVREFVDRLFGGDAGPLVQFLAEEGRAAISLGHKWRPINPYLERVYITLVGWTMPTVFSGEPQERGFSATEHTEDTEQMKPRRTVE